MAMPLRRLRGGARASGSRRGRGSRWRLCAGAVPRRHRHARQRRHIHRIWLERSLRHYHAGVRFRGSCVCGSPPQRLAGRRRRRAAGGALRRRSFGAPRIFIKWSASRTRSRPSSASSRFLVATVPAARHAQRRAPRLRPSPQGGDRPRRAQRPRTARRCRRNASQAGGGEARVRQHALACDRPDDAGRMDGYNRAVQGAPRRSATSATNFDGVGRAIGVIVGPTYCGWR